MEQLTDTILSNIIQTRPAESYKGMFGHVVLIGGNETYGGAIIMSAEAAVKSGAGLVSVVTHPTNHTALHARLPEAMVMNWHKEIELVDLINQASVILIGPGLGLDDYSKKLLSLVLTHQKKTQWLVIDGSAITLFASNHLTVQFPETVVFTPHQMEWQRLSQIKIVEQTEKKNHDAQQLLKATVVLKSHRTTIYTSKAIYQNPLGTAAMATGGMGDTLAGIITGFLAQFPQKIDAICAAVYLHSLIGDTLAASNYVVLPTEISRCLPRFMKQFE